MPTHAALLRIYTEEARRADGRPLYEALVLRARDAGVAGATVLRGPMGYGSSTRLHNANILDLSANLPLVIEMVDSEERLRAFAASLAGFKDVGLVTLEKVEVLREPHVAAPR